MSELRLGAVDMAPKDVAYLRALVRLFSHTEKLRWSFADAAPYHAVVAPPRARAANPGFFDAFKGVVLTLADTPGAQAVDTVAYPIRANQLRDWLKLRQGSWDSAASVPQEVDGRRFKLRRWPQAALLQGDPAALRMATLMSRSPLSTTQLAAMTQQPELACRAFVDVLMTAGLLVEVAVATGAPSAIAAAAPVRTGLMASLRRHLGLQERS
jgi:hypothetical protein